MTVRCILVILTIVLSAHSSAAEARILKVLPHLLDSKGRNALSPSLYERDAYQSYLRRNPEEISALRFDVQFKAKSNDPLILRIEVRGSKMALGQKRIFESDIQPRRFFSAWGELNLDKKVYEEIGSVVAWRATLRRGGVELAEQQSFLW